MKKCTGRGGGGGGGGMEWKKMKIDRQEQKEEQMRPQPSAYSCFLSLTVQILTLHSNPITLPNWIGCARCSDRIKASIPQLRDEGSPADHKVASRRMDLVASVQLEIEKGKKRRESCR